mmetsp:Transcript_26364/g.60740  ORF Transcript_26364/g.60740 Transcript_26364/m.60740 type:complete len:246 (-) Transcript_26364:53-790(-)
MSVGSVQRKHFFEGEPLHHVDGGEAFGAEPKAGVGFARGQVHRGAEAEAGHQVLDGAHAEQPGLAHLQLPPVQREPSPDEGVLPAGLELPHPQLRLEIRSQSEDRLQRPEPLSQLQRGPRIRPHLQTRKFVAVAVDPAAQGGRGAGGGAARRDPRGAAGAGARAGAAVVGQGGGGAEDGELAADALDGEAGGAVGVGEGRVGGDEEEREGDEEEGAGGAGRRHGGVLREIERLTERAVVGCRWGP